MRYAVKFLVLLPVLMASVSHAVSSVEQLSQRRNQLFAEGAAVVSNVWTVDTTADLNSLTEVGVWDLAMVSTSSVRNPATSKMFARDVSMSQSYALESKLATGEAGPPLFQVRYVTTDCFLYSMSNVVRSGGGDIVRHQVNISSAEMPLGSPAVSEIHLGIFSSEMLIGEVSTVDTSDGVQVTIVRSDERDVVRVDKLGRPLRWVRSTQSSSPSLPDFVLQWQYDAENKWPTRCVVLMPQSANRLSVARYDLLEVKPFVGSVADRTSIGMILTVVDHRRSVVEPVAMEAPGVQPLTVADVLKASEATNTAEVARRVVPPDSTAYSIPSWIWFVIAVTTGVIVVVILRSHRKSVAK
jgi:hypothetical protein